jgi:formylglycine-generating enzyme required for sulfatase activity
MVETVGRGGSSRGGVVLAALCLFGCERKPAAARDDVPAPAPVAAPASVAPTPSVETQVRSLAPVAVVPVAKPMAKTIEVAAGQVEIDGKTSEVAAFAIDRTEVTTDDYAACVAAKKCTPASSRHSDCNWPKRKRRGQHPINCVTVKQAVAYCTRNGQRLPTEAEWQLAAGGPEKRLYPWGDAHPSNLNVDPLPEGPLQPGPARHHLCWEGDRSERGGKYPETTCLVGAFEAGNTPSGIADLAGNVWELTSTLEDAERGEYVTKGGSFVFDPLAGRVQVAVTDSSVAFASETYTDVGFRCASDRAVR